MLNLVHTLIARLKLLRTVQVSTHACVACFESSVVLTLTSVPPQSKLNRQLALLGTLPSSGQLTHALSAGALVLAWLH
jgi:hypothetical protein